LRNRLGLGKRASSGRGDRRAAGQEAPGFDKGLPGLAGCVVEEKEEDKEMGENVVEWLELFPASMGRKKCRSAGSPASERLGDG